MPEYQLDVKCGKGNFKTEWTTDMEETIKSYLLFRTRLPIDTNIEVYCRDAAKMTLEL